MPMYTVEVGVVGVCRVEVEAENAGEAKERAEDCVSPLSVDTWDYLPDWAVPTNELDLVTHA
jgi:hypothetical protein